MRRNLHVLCLLSCCFDNTNVTHCTITQPHQSGRLPPPLSYQQEQNSHIGSGCASSSLRRLTVFRSRAFPDRPFLIFPGLALAAIIIPRLASPLSIAVLLPNRSAAAHTPAHGVLPAPAAVLLLTTALNEERSMVGQQVHGV